MNTKKDKILYKDLSYKIVGLAMEVHKKLGYGFLEKVYENALVILFRREGIQSEQQSPIKVYFEGETVGNYVADIFVDNKIILELKCVEKIADVHRAQVLNYLKATKTRLAIILNFAKDKLEYERLVL
ncbi:MAG: GxxExxY protein [Deltaproteobacteria bacterium]|nr:GxxExxY protein [Deltaproteobacteria bacterium]